MWRIWHKLFGWDYVMHGSNGWSGVLRVTIDKNSRVYYINKDGTAWILRNPDRLIWLTCHPSKYFNTPPPPPTESGSGESRY